MKLSVIILAKNAEDILIDCIESVYSIADEIILVDNESSDRTVDLAKMKGAKIIESSEKSFAKRRNIGLHKARGEWVLYIDTDERVTPELKKNIQWTISNLQQKMPVAYKLQRKNFYLGNHPWPRIEKLERLFKRSHLKEWYGDLHESPRIEGEIGELGGYLLHFTHRDLSSMLEKTIRWSDEEAMLRFMHSHPRMAWWRFPRVMFTAFFDSYIKQGGFRAGTMGLIESIYQAFSMFITYGKLWELQEK